MNAGPAVPDGYVVSCPYCGRHVRDGDFDEVSFSEYAVSGLCPLCQKDIADAVRRWDGVEDQGAPYRRPEPASGGP
jgi:endogenous inhibitor of DNA gyrase (YacG/DUF329 family)